MYCILNNANKIGQVVKSNIATQLGLKQSLTKIGSVYYCGSNNRMTSNIYMQHIWSKYKTKNTTLKFKSCFSNTYNSGDAYYLLTDNGNLYVGGESDSYVLGIYNNGYDIEEFTQVNSVNDSWKKVIGVYSCYPTNYPNCYFLTDSGKMFFSGRAHNGYAYYGNNNTIMLGSVTEQFSESNVLVDDVVCFNQGSLILDKDRYIWAKGLNDKGQLGYSNDGYCYYYQKISLSKDGGIPQNNWVKIAAGFNSCYALNSLGQLYCWGGNEYGQLGLGITSEFVTEPQLVGNGVLFDDISAGSHHMICKDIQGNIYTAGLNSYGQLGDYTTNNSCQLKKIFSNINVRKVVAGQRNSAIIDVYGGCYCVGYSNNTIIMGYRGNVLQWTKLGYIKKITHIAMSCNNFCLIGE